TNVPQRFRAESADLKIIFHDRERLAQAVDARCEKLSLIIEAWPPGEHAPDIQSFAFDLFEHVLGRNAFGGARVMRAAGAMDVMIAAIETGRRRVNPPFELEGKLR